MENQLIQSFEIAVRKIHNDPNLPTPELQKPFLEKLIHQYMLNEFGFNYLLELEYNNDIFDIYREMNLLAFFH